VDRINLTKPSQLSMKIVIHREAKSGWVEPYCGHEDQKKKRKKKKLAFNGNIFVSIDMSRHTP
jgi:hypothetical protein